MSVITIALLLVLLFAGAAVTAELDRRLKKTEEQMALIKLRTDALAQVLFEQQDVRHNLVLLFAGAAVTAGLDRRLKKTEEQMALIKLRTDALAQVLFEQQDVRHKSPSCICKAKE